MSEETVAQTVATTKDNFSGFSGEIIRISVFNSVQRRIKRSHPH